MAVPARSLLWLPSRAADAADPPPMDKDRERVSRKFGRERTTFSFRRHVTHLQA